MDTEHCYMSIRIQHSTSSYPKIHPCLLYSSDDIEQPKPTVRQRKCGMRTQMGSYRKDIQTPPSSGCSFRRQPVH